MNIGFQRDQRMGYQLVKTKVNTTDARQVTTVNQMCMIIDHLHYCIFYTYVRTLPEFLFTCVCMYVNCT